jgi:uncharacterized protein YjiS (DUF1127 family)
MRPTMWLRRSIRVRQHACASLSLAGAALLDWQERVLLRERLCNLSDRELRDIGITHGEIDYVATNRAIDPRGAVLAP